MPTAESPRQVDEGTQPSDPFLKLGCFIYPSDSCDTETSVPGTPNYPRDSSSIGADVAVDSDSSRITNSNGTEVPEATGLSSAEDLKGRGGYGPLPTPPIGCQKYYCDPVSRHVFCSKNEVLHYVQTGTRLKRKKNAYVPDCEATDIDSSGGRKQKKVAARLLPPTLDFDNVPTVTWVLKDSSKDLWVPHMDNHEVPNSVNNCGPLRFRGLHLNSGD